MQVDHNVTIPKHLAVLAALAHLLERLEHAPHGLDAGQYRSVVQRLSQELASVTPDATLTRVLALFPATAELYENLRYEQAGLCLHPLELSLNTEKSAADVLRRVAVQSRPA